MMTKKLIAIMKMKWMGAGRKLAGVLGFICRSLARSCRSFPQTSRWRLQSMTSKESALNNAYRHLTDLTYIDI